MPSSSTTTTSIFSPSLLLPALLLLFSPSTSASTLDCMHITASKQNFDLSALGGAKTVHKLGHNLQTATNTSFTIDLCRALVPAKDVDKELRCRLGTRICGIEHVEDGTAEGKIDDVIEIAGQYAVSSGGALEPKWELLNKSGSHADAGREGLRGELSGGKHKGVKQKAIIEFLCAKDVEGTEGFGDETGKERREEGEGEKEGDGEESGGDGEQEVPESDKGKALRLVSYETEDDIGVLRLEWKTRYVCAEGERGGPPAGGAKKAGWGFFTWFLIIAFLLAAAYIIFGSWLNYNRYGARGWDLIPHGDTIRDLPYIVKDLGAGVMDKLRGSGSRGGYSAV